MQVHPSSISAKEKIFGTPYVLYEDRWNAVPPRVRDGKKISKMYDMGVSLNGGTSKTPQNDYV